MIFNRHEVSRKPWDVNSSNSYDNKKICLDSNKICNSNEIEKSNDWFKHKESNNDFRNSKDRSRVFKD